MDIIVWLILCLIFSVSLIIFHYWMELFHKSDTYTKHELTDFGAIVRSKLRDMPEAPLMAAGYFQGIILSWLIVLFGGLVSPDISPAPDYAENTAANYFFQSFLFPLLLSFLWPSLKDLISNFDPGKISSIGNGFLIGCSASLAGVNLSMWGVYHETSFLYMFLNGIILLIFSAYKLDKQYNKPEEYPESSFSEDEPRDISEDSLSDEDLEI